MRFDHVADSQKLKEAHLGMTGAATPYFHLRSGTKTRQDWTKNAPE
jgi:hypothetical protein